MIIIEDIFTDEQIQRMNIAQRHLVDYCIRIANNMNMSSVELRRYLFWYSAMFYHQVPAFRISKKYIAIFTHLKNRGLVSNIDQININKYMIY